MRVVDHSLQRSSRKAYSCSFAAGRYYVSTSGVGTLTQAHQQASASYLMVKDAK